ncbi:MAG: DUF1987 domain-containing protein [Bernardetiaceae bacterium]|jgi:hypothetical protein|nr:DUF1987 domain-containing protein [Bernardetiaceae bacterium]
MTNNYYLAETNKTPQLNFDGQSGHFVMAGRSIPENSIEFYQPLFNWLDHYSTAPQPRTVFDIKLEYFNTSSSKCLVEIFRRLEKLPPQSVVINWYYEPDDEDMLDSGGDFKNIVAIPINMIAIQ